MGNWAEIRARARRVVHNSFSLPATYLAPGADPADAIPCNVRMHSVLKVFGDLDREMFAQMLDNQNHIVIDTLEVADVDKKGKVSVYTDSERTLLVGECTIRNILPKTDEFLRVEVTL